MSKFPVETLKSKNIPTNEDYLLKWGGEENFDIGCGPSKIDGFKGLDIIELPLVDIVHDLNVKPWPIDTSSANLVIVSHVIEHIDSVITMMSELHRILKKDGKLVIRYPHYSQRHAFTDPTHKRFMTLESLDYFIYESKLFNVDCKFGFKLIRKIINADNKIAWMLSKLSFEAYEKYWCKLFPAWQVIIELKK